MRMAEVGLAFARCPAQRLLLLIQPETAFKRKEFILHQLAETAVSLAPPLSQNLPLRTVEHDVDTHYGGKVVEQFLHFAVKDQIKRKIVVRGRHPHSPF